jgi:hypothetical protein
VLTNEILGVGEMFALRSRSSAGITWSIIGTDRRWRPFPLIRDDRPPAPALRGVHRA